MLKVLQFARFGIASPHIKILYKFSLKFISHLHTCQLARFGREMHELDHLPRMHDRVLEKSLKTRIGQNLHQLARMENLLPVQRAIIVTTRN